MVEKIQDHFNDEEIIKLEIEPDMVRWEEILEFNKKEIEFLINLLSDEGKESEKTNSLRQKITAIGKMNKKNHETFLDFGNTLKDWRECDEMACETHYLKQYFSLKEMLLKHFESYRTEKEKVYAHFRGE